MFIHFAGVQSALYLWVNGEKVGYHEDGMLPSEFNITPYLKKGENEMTVQVFNWSVGSYLEDQDYWRLSGIYRDVFLFATPNVRMRDFSVYPELDEQYRDAQLLVEVDVQNLGFSSNEELVVQTTLKDPEGRVAGNGNSQQFRVKRGTEESLKITIPVENPLKWTAETPHLYQLSIELTTAAGDPLQAFVVNTGFRKIEIEGGRSTKEAGALRIEESRLRSCQHPLRYHLRYVLVDGSLGGPV